MSGRLTPAPERSARLVAFAIAAAVAALPARADPADELTSLRREAAQKRQSLNDLDARIRALENANPVASSPGDMERTKAAPVESGAPAESAFFVLQKNWSEIRPGTSQQRVDALLGKPERVMRINGDLAWYYVYPGLGRGSVFFNEEGRVSSAQAPRHGWSW
jgi:hypothetical protein